MVIAVVVLATLAALAVGAAAVGWQRVAMLEQRLEIVRERREGVSRAILRLIHFEAPPIEEPRD